MNPSVSVIIPNYNCAPWLPKVVKTCIIQDFLHEIIIVDDHSTDNSWAVLQNLQEKHPDLIKIYKNPQKGGNNARNYGFSKSSGKFIQWLDADDFLLEGKFKNQLKVFEEKPETDIVYSDWYLDFYENNTSFIDRKNYIYDHYNDFLFEILSDNWSANNSYLYKRKITELLHQINAWNPETVVAQDREYITLAALNNARFSYAPGYYCIYNRWNSNSVSSISFGERLKHQINLEYSFRQIVCKNKYPPKKQRKYLALLNAHTLNACYYYPKLTILNKFSIFNVNWKIIHWKKRAFIPFIYIWQHIKLLFTYHNKS